MKHTRFLFAAVVFLFMAVPAYAASVDYFIKIDGVEGETKTESATGEQIHYGTVGKTFILDASRSTDDGTARTFSWRQVSGPYKFDTQSGSRVSVTPPTAGTYAFELSVSDATGRVSATERVQIVVALKNTGIEPDEIDYDGSQETNFGVLLDGGESGGGDDGEEKKGNVETEWKVEKGESMMESEGEMDVSIPQTNGNTVSVRAVEVRGWDPEKKEEFLSTVKVHAEVASGQDLENFARGILVSDENIKDIEVSDDEIEIEYRARGKLLGFIPLSFSERITVRTTESEEERVRIRFPWFSFLLQADVSTDDIARAIGDELDKENVQFNPLATGGTVDVSAQANIFAQALQTISNVLKTKHDTAKNSVNNIR